MPPSDDNAKNGRARGGRARAAKMSPLERSDIARLGAAARWEKHVSPPSAPRIPESAVVKLLDALDPAPYREGLKDTPARVVKAWAHWTSGYTADTDALLKTFEDGAEEYDEAVFVGSIPFYSHCEHHMAPFFGVAHVAYIPQGRVVGLSKIPRLVDAFARRLTVQERITTQVANAMFDVLKPSGVGVILQARHMCVESRGVSKPGTITTTTALRGVFKSDASVRAEFLSTVALQGQFNAR